MSKDKETWIDPIVAEVRKTREEIAKQFGYDISAYCKHLRSKRSEWEAQGRKYVTRPPKLVEGKTGTND